MKIPSLLAIVCVAIFYLVLPTICFLTIKNERKLKITFIVFFIAFAVILFFATICQIDISLQQTTINFNFSQGWCNKTINFSPYTKSLADFLINITMLFPVGLTVFTLSKQKTWVKIILCFVLGMLTGLIIETYQFILPVARSVQLSDVILNGLSALIGGLYMWFIASIKNKVRK